MKVIINEKIIKELYTSTNNKVERESVASEVYLGRKIVKKIAKKDEYNGLQLKVFKLMQQHPEVFAWTKIINKRLVIQEKLDAVRARNDYLSLFEKMRLHHLNSNFRYILEMIIIKGIEKYEEDIKFIKKLLDDEEDILILNKLVSLTEKVHEIYRENHFLKNYMPDFHAGNIGYDKNNDLKILDFINDSEMMP